MAAADLLGGLAAQMIGNRARAQMQANEATREALAQIGASRLATAQFLAQHRQRQQLEREAGLRAMLTSAMNQGMAARESAAERELRSSEGAANRASAERIAAMREGGNGGEKEMNFNRLMGGVISEAMSGVSGPYTKTLEAMKSSPTVSPFLPGYSGSEQKTPEDAQRAAAGEIISSLSEALPLEADAKTVDKAVSTQLTRHKPTFSPEDFAAIESLVKQAFPPPASQPVAGGGSGLFGRMFNQSYGPAMVQRNMAVLDFLTKSPGFDRPWATPTSQPSSLPVEELWKGVYEAESRLPRSRRGSRF